MEFQCRARTVYWIRQYPLNKECHDVYIDHCGHNCGQRGLRLARRLLCYTQMPAPAIRRPRQAIVSIQCLGRFRYVVCTSQLMISSDVVVFQKPPLPERWWGDPATQPAHFHPGETTVILRTSALFHPRAPRWSMGLRRASHGTGSKARLSRVMLLHSLLGIPHRPRLSTGTTPLLSAASEAPSPSP